jgi:hypothetical protein
MSFTMLLLSAEADPSWPEKIGQAVPGAVAKILADPEPLLHDSPLSGMPNVLIPPHGAILGTACRREWQAIPLENCRRFAADRQLFGQAAMAGL